MAANPSIQLGTDGNWAIKEDNLLAYKKDGTRFFNKEFDFTRGSLATFVDKDGLIKVSGVTDTELVTNGNFDNNSDWSEAGSVEIANSSANFTITSGSFAKISQNISLTNSKTYKLTLQVLGDNSGSNIYVRDTATGDDGGLQEVIILVEGTTDYTFYFTANANSNAIYIKRNTSSGNYQFSINNVSVKEIQTDVPRIDFTDDATGHLLLEPQSTNLLQYSEDFSEWNKGGNTTVIPNFAISPDGTQNATRFQTPTGSGTYLTLAASMTSGNVYTLTLYLKNNGGENVDIGVSGTSSVTNVVASIEVNLTNEWVRYELNFTADSNSNFVFIDNISNANSVDCLIWGAQLEQKSFSTSYIPNHGVSGGVTRLADVCNNSGSVQDFNSEEGVLYAEISALADSGTNRIFGISNGGDFNNSVLLRFSSASNRIQAQVRLGGVYQCSLNYDVSNATEFNKIAFKYKQNDFSLYVNGVERATDTSGNVITGLDVLDFDISTTNEFYGKTKNLKVFKRAMSDGELYLLTVTQYQSYQEMATALNYTL